MNQRLLDHEKLNVYQKSLALIAWLEPVLQSLEAKTAAKDQLDRASTSIPLNIAEGNGRYTDNDRCHFFDIARGSALECAAALDVLKAKGRISEETAFQGKTLIKEVIAMLVGLIKSNSGFRAHEDAATYEATTRD